MPELREHACLGGIAGTASKHAGHEREWRYSTSMLRMQENNQKEVCLRGNADCDLNAASVMQSIDP